MGKKTYKYLKHNLDAKTNEKYKVNKSLHQSCDDADYIHIQGCLPLWEVMTNDLAACCVNNQNVVLE
jgi:hypothetical protein